MAAADPRAANGWRPLAIPGDGQADRNKRDGETAATSRSARRDPGDKAQTWLRNAMLALALLAAAAAAVSWEAQFQLVRSVKHNVPIAALEAGIPDIGALIFAALGIALALHGKHAIRARTLNIACVGISLTMNALASAPGWRDMAIWVMPSAVYALASDTLIGVIRAWVIARSRRTGLALANDEATPMTIIGGLLLWLLRLALAPPSTITGFRRWALEECPVAPGRKAPPRQRSLPAGAEHRQLLPGQFPPQGQGPGQHPTERRSPARRTTRPGKQDRLLALAAERHDLPTVPLRQVSRIANTIAAEIDLSPGTARRVLLNHVRALQDDGRPATGQPRTGEAETGHRHATERTADQPNH